MNTETAENYITKKLTDQPELIQEFVTHLRGKKKGKVSTYYSSNYIYSILKVVVHLTTLYRLIPTKNDIDNYLARIKSKHSMYYYLKHYIDFLLEKELITPVEYTAMTKEKHKNEKQIILNPKDKKKKAIPKDQWIEVYNQLGKAHYQMYAWIGFNFGLRSDEILNLTWKDIDFDQKLLYIQPKDFPVKWQPKTKTSIRAIPMTDSQILVLKNYKANLPDIASDYVIISLAVSSQAVKNKPISNSQPNFWFEKITVTIPGIGPKHFTAHSLRYSFATHVYYNTNVKDPLMWVSKLLGHATLQQTEHYLELNQYETNQRMRECMAGAGL